MVARVLIALSATLDFFDKEQTEYAIVEDNAVETIISVDKGDEITLLSINRFEDGGGLWEVTYDRGDGRVMDKCTWRLEDYDYGHWESECGLSWYMSNDGTPIENNMNYCPKCGRELVEEVKE